MTRAVVPPPGAAPLPAPNAAALLRGNGTDPDTRDRVAVRFGDAAITHGDFYRGSCRWANLMIDRHARRGGGVRPLHVGVLLDNTPDYLLAIGGAALSGSVVVGCNHTRRGEHLLRDLRHTDVDLLVTEPRHWQLLAPIADDLPELLVSTRFADRDDPDPVAGQSLDDVLGAVSGDDPGAEPDVDTTWLLIFTSGTSSAPKAVICSQRRLLVTGNRMGIVMGLDAQDVGYVCMPLFHSNALMVGWAPSVVLGASVGLARRFSASRWLADVRHYGATYFNYTGKPLGYILATPELPDDADNPLRVAFGNEGSPDMVAEFSRRFGVEVIDAYGATEGGIGVNRTGGGPTGALGQAPENVQVVDADGHSLPPARFDAHGRLVNAEECVGEIVNTEGSGPFEGYYNNPEATERTTRSGWYWSGDLGYLDEDRYLYFAGRDADWIRVDGENFPAAPIEAALSRHPDVAIAAVYGVPDVNAGDQVMAALILREGARFDPAEFATWLDSLGDLGPKWLPRYVRIATELPTTGTNKVVKRMLVTQKWRRDRVGADAIWFRGRDDSSYRPFISTDEETLASAFADAGRDRFWDL